MSPPLEHDYIGLSAADGGTAGRPSLNLKATELRLGPPGSESPDRGDTKKPLGLTLDLLPAKPGFVSGAKRGFSDASGAWAFAAGVGSDAEAAKGAAGGAPVKEGVAAVAAELEKKAQAAADRAPAPKAQVVGWPPIRSYRKNTMATSNPVKNKEDTEAKQGMGCLYVKVSMDGAPYLRKVDLNMYCNYKELSYALEKMFSGFTGQCGGQGIPGRDGPSDSWLKDILNGSEYVLTYEDKDGDWMLVGDVPWKMFIDSCRRMRIMKGSDAIGLAPRAMEKCKNRN
uniref:Auxin-responsive protein n=1 Tax=Lilium regale TaxID=82328 RepID=A0A649UAK6_LILRE|nr:auxin-responsive protein IAA17 [Lilium regale]